MFSWLCVRNFIEIGHLISKLWSKNPISDENIRISLRQSWKKRLGQFVRFGSKSLPPPFPPMQCWSESCCQRPRQVAQHWLMGVGKDMTNGELGGFFKTMHCPKCRYNREHWDNCNKVDQVSQLFFSRIVGAANFTDTLLSQGMQIHFYTLTVIHCCNNIHALVLLSCIISPVLIC